MSIRSSKWVLLSSSSKWQSIIETCSAWRYQVQVLYYEEKAVHVWKDLEKVSPNWSICWTGSNILRSLTCSGRISTSIGRCKGGMTGGSVLVMSPQTYGLLCLSVIEREPNQKLHCRKDLFKANIIDVMATHLLSLPRQNQDCSGFIKSFFLFFYVEHVNKTKKKIMLIISFFFFHVYPVCVCVRVKP